MDGVIDETGGAHHVPTSRLQPGVHQARREYAESGPRRLWESGTQKNSEGELLPARHKVNRVLRIRQHLCDVVVEDPERVNLFPPGKGHAAILARQGASGEAAPMTIREVEIHAFGLPHTKAPGSVFERTVKVMVR